ncbi:MAG: hypothetical protein ACUVR0_12195, partial [Candidatus Aminicenantales bacterium]
VYKRPLREGRPFPSSILRCHPVPVLKFPPGFYYLRQTFLLEEQFSRLKIRALTKEKNYDRKKA